MWHPPTHFSHFTVTVCSFYHRRQCSIVGTTRWLRILPYYTDHTRDVNTTTSDSTCHVYCSPSIPCFVIQLPRTGSGHYFTSSTYLVGYYIPLCLRIKCHFRLDKSQKYYTLSIRKESKDYTLSIRQESKYYTLSIRQESKDYTLSIRQESKYYNKIMTKVKAEVEGFGRS